MKMCKGFMNTVALICLLVLAYFLIAMFGWTAANSTEVGKQTYHGSDMRAVCELTGYDDAMCRLTMETRINRFISEHGKQTSTYSVPSSATEEDIDNKIAKVLKLKNKQVEQGDASGAVYMALVCLYPTDSVKEKVAQDIICKGSQ